jgi:phospholipid/cholesterol/gamma-HCH transport system ATP-binding protein
VVVTHDLSSIYHTVDRCILLDEEARAIIAEGDPRTLRDEAEDPRVRDFFHRPRDVERAG